MSRNIIVLFTILFYFSCICFWIETFFISFFFFNSFRFSRVLIFVQKLRMFLNVQRQRRHSFRVIFGFRLIYRMLSIFNTFFFFTSVSVVDRSFFSHIDFHKAMYVSEMYWTKGENKKMGNPLNNSFGYDDKSTEIV